MIVAHLRSWRRWYDILLPLLYIELADLRTKLGMARAALAVAMEVSPSEGIMALKVDITSALTLLTAMSDNIAPKRHVWSFFPEPPTLDEATLLRTRLDPPSLLLALPLFLRSFL